MEAEERVTERKDKMGSLISEELNVSAQAESKRKQATMGSTNINAQIKRMEEELRQSELFISSGGEEGKDTVTNVFGTDVEAEEEALADKRAAIKAKKTQLTNVTAQEQTQLDVINTQEQEDIKNLNEQQVVLQTEQTADQKIIAEGSTTTASAIQNSVPHMRTDIGLAMGLDHTDKLTPGEDIASAANNMYGDNSTSALANVINAPVTNARNSNTTINMPQPRMASDPNTQKQSGYALSGWAKFD